MYVRLKSSSWTAGGIRNRNPTLWIILVWIRLRIRSEFASGPWTEFVVFIKFKCKYGRSLPLFFFVNFLLFYLLFQEVGRCRMLKDETNSNMLGLNVICFIFIFLLIMKCFPFLWKFFVRSRKKTERRTQLFILALNSSLFLLVPCKSGARLNSCPYLRRNFWGFLK
jgi:hypothetical protein